MKLSISCSMVWLWGWGWCELILKMKTDPFGEKKKGGGGEDIQVFNYI